MRKQIIRAIKENRGEYDDPLNECPFPSCSDFCYLIFPKWAERIHTTCPCGDMGRSYIKRRMKKLFPEGWRRRWMKLKR